MTNTEFLFKYLNNASPTGFESLGQKIWLDYIKPFIDDYLVDTYGTVVGIINPEAEYKVVIEAHADEISWFVNYITDEGYIYVVRNGGSDPIIAPSMRVNVHGKNGIVKGVFGWPAIHVRMGSPKDDPKPEIKNIIIDVGANSKDEVKELGIHVGTVITLEGDLMEMNNRYYTGRALDNRLGGYLIAEVARKIHENGKKPAFGVYVVNSVQEEIGLRGAEMITQNLKPNVAIVTDVCHDTYSPLYNKVRDGDIKGGNGPVLSYAPAVHNKLRDMMIDVAEKNDIPFQRMASSRSTGTDTDAFAYSNGGIPSSLISVPLKYMHTTVETAHKDDIENAIKLMYESVMTLEVNQDFRYFL